MKTSIVILTYNKLDYTKQCIASIRQHTAPGTYEMIIVDNNSTDDTVAWLRQQPDLRLILNENNEGFPKGCNQGIEIATGDNILLLNNDTVVTPGWLDQLVTALYSSEDIGAVGPVTNYSAYGQTIPVSYQSMTEMQAFASSYNRLNPNEWEERLKLIGFCLLIKTSVVRQVGLLDEIFTPGNFEDDDYSLRIRRAGYRLLFCRDTFIHHYGSISWRDNIDKFHNLLHRNEQKFIDKWGYNSSYAMNIQFGMVELMQLEPDRPIRVLEVGCNCGGTLLYIKHLNKKAKLYGLEENPHAAQEALPFSDVRIASLDDRALLYPEGFFDYILLSNVLESSGDPKRALEQAMKYLKPGGTVIAAVKHLAHYSVIQRLLKGQPLYAQENIRYFTLSELEALFNAIGFQNLGFIGQQTHKTPDDEQFLQQLSQTVAPDLLKTYSVSQYLLRARKESTGLLALLQEIENDVNTEENIKRLSGFSTAEVMQTVQHNFQDKTALLNKLAILHFGLSELDNVLPYLHTAYDWQPNNPDTLYNLGFVLHSFGEHEMADGFLQQIPAPDEESLALMTSMRTQLEAARAYARELKYLLRRVEFDVDREASLRALVQELTDERVDTQSVVALATQHLVTPANVLNQLGAAAFEQEQYDYVLPLLQTAHELAPTDDHVLYNLGYVLNAMGEFALACSFLEQIEVKDQDVLQLISACKGEFHIG